MNSGRRAREIAMTSWFVSTTRQVEKGVEWRLTPHASEEEARKFASHALIRGLRVEAGTVPGQRPAVRIGWKGARLWAQGDDDNTIMGLRRRLAAFAA
jgi:hypothetical protein